MLCNIERFSLFNENFLTYFRMFHHGLLVEFPTTVVAGYKSTNLSVLVGLVPVAEPRSGVSGSFEVSNSRWWVLTHHLNWWLLLCPRLLLLLARGLVLSHSWLVGNAFVYGWTVSNSGLATSATERIIRFVIVLATRRSNWSRRILFSVLVSLMNIQINRVRLVFQRNLPYWFLVSLWLILSSFVLIIRLRNADLSSLIVRRSTKQNIVDILDGVSLASVVVLRRRCVRFEYFSVVLVLAALVRLLSFGLSIEKGSLIRHARRFRNMSKLLIVTGLVVTLTIASAFRLYLLSWVVCVNSFARLLVPR